MPMSWKQLPSICAVPMQPNNALPFDGDPHRLLLLLQHCEQARKNVELAATQLGFIYARLRCENPLDHAKLKLANIEGALELAVRARDEVLDSQLNIYELACFLQTQMS